MVSGLAKKALSSLFVGGALGAGPYGIAVSSSVISGRDLTPVNSKDPGFGEMCYLEEDICEALKDEEWEEDTEQITEEEAKKNPEYESDYWKARKDDYCGWGFQWEELNTYLECDKPDATQRKYKNGKEDRVEEKKEDKVEEKSKK